MTTSIRLHVDTPLHPGAEPEMTPGQAHYLGSVMRRGVGDEVRLFNGTDGEFLARIAGLRRDRGRFAVEQQVRPQNEGPDLWLAFAPLKRDATELVVQKATELGVAAILPVITERTNLPRLNAERLAAIATEAAEQCERLTVPRLAPPRRLRQVLDEWPLAAWPEPRPLVVAMERVDVPPIRAAPGPAALLVGPEGGFTGAELDELRRRPFVHPATLGALILRAETAAIVGLALLQAPAGG